MKKNLHLLFISLTLFLTFTSFTLQAADLSAGATAWYTAWDCILDDEADAEYNPSFLYGPVISASFTQDLGMSFVFLYGKFDTDAEDSTGKITRYDSDLTLNYRIGEWFKLFAGIKYIGFTWSEDGKHEALGPGAGISAVIPVGGNFFVLGYLSGLYLEGNEKFNSYGETYNLESNEYGCNASLSLAYYISGTSTTISLGGRFQQLRINYDEADAPDNTNRFYGATLTAVYSFNI